MGYLASLLIIHLEPVWHPSERDTDRVCVEITRNYEDGYTHDLLMKSFWKN